MTSGTKRTRSSSVSVTPAPSAVRRRAAARPCRPARPAGRPAQLRGRARADARAGRGGDVDRVVGRVLGQPARAVADRERHVLHARRPRSRRRARGQLGVELDRVHTCRPAGPAARRGSPSRCRRRARVRSRASSSSSHMRATTSGWEIVWPAADRQRDVVPRLAARSRGTKRSRGTAATAASTRSSRMCRRSVRTSRSEAAVDIRPRSLPQRAARPAPARSRRVRCRRRVSPCCRP